MQAWWPRKAPSAGGSSGAMMKPPLRDRGPPCPGGPLSLPRSGDPQTSLQVAQGGPDFTLNGTWPGPCPGPCLSQAAASFGSSPWRSGPRGGADCGPGAGGSSWASFPVSRVRLGASWRGVRVRPRQVRRAPRGRSRGRQLAQPPGGVGGASCTRCGTLVRLGGPARFWNIPSVLRPQGSLRSCLGGGWPPWLGGVAGLGEGPSLLLFLVSPCGSAWRPSSPTGCCPPDSPHGPGRGRLASTTRTPPLELPPSPAGVSSPPHRRTRFHLVTFQGSAPPPPPPVPL